MHASPRYIDRLQTLSEISRVLSATLDLPALYEAIDRQIDRMIPLSGFALALLQPGRDSLHLPYQRVGATVYRDRRILQEETLIGHVLSQGKPLLFQSRAEMLELVDEGNLALSQESTGQATMYVPLNTGSRTIGVMWIENLHQAVYDEADLETLLAIASHAAVAIENAQLYARSREAQKQMEALLHVARVLNSSHDLASALGAILLSMNQVMPFSYAAILLPDHSTQTLTIMGSVRRQGAIIVQEPMNSTLKIPFGEGITGTVFITGSPVIVSDVRTHPGYIDHGLRDVLSEMAIPLRRGESVVGVLDVGREGVDAFSLDELNVLLLFASQAAIAIENARLISEQRRRADELQAIQTIIQKIGPHHDPSTIGTLINRELKGLIDYWKCRIFLHDERSGELLSLGEDPTLAPRLRLGEGFAGWVAAHNRGDIIRNTLLDRRVHYARGEDRQATSMIGVPMHYKDRVRGAITLSKLGEDQFDENALRVLQIIAAQAAIAFDRARVYGELRIEAITDPVVKLSNRRYLMERFKEERSRSMRSGCSLACLMMDIDGFKKVNDTYGHDAGDVVLQELATLIRRQVRLEDIPARYGGEEFCILLPDSPLDMAFLVGERLRHAIEAHHMPPAAGITNVTASVGLALFSPTDSATEMFTRADGAMYRAKAAGGNRLWVASTETVEA